MAVVSVTQTDTGDGLKSWRIPGEPLVNTTFIPRGIRTYSGSAAVAAKGAPDQTRCTITLTFPTNFHFLIKSFTCRFTSDDTVNDFNSTGAITYVRGVGTFTADPMVEITSSGTINRGGAVAATKVYQMAVGAPRFMSNGAAGDSVLFDLADVSADASSAGDVLWLIEFFMFDQEQVLTWPINTCDPVFIC